MKQLCFKQSSIAIKIILFFLPVLIFAKGLYYSYLPLPEIEFIGFDDNQTKLLQEQLLTNNTKEKKIAILFPGDIIKRYSIMVSNSVISYLIASEDDFYLKLYDCKDESLQNIQNALLKLKKDGFKYCIAPLTKQGAKVIAPLIKDIYLFIPTVNSGDVDYENYLITYGGIDYKKQINKLKQFMQKQLIIFDEPGAISSNVTNTMIHETNSSYTILTMKTHIVKYENIFNVLQTDLNTTAIINTQPIKSSLLLSQFSYQDINISKILSTQINYSPLLLALTQAKDLKKLYIANSITTKNNKIEDINSLLHNDIAYNWINYSTTILMDFIFQSINKEYSSKSKHFDLMSHDKQILYPVGIYKVRYKRFFRYK